MKKIFTLILTLIISISIIGCKSKSTEIFKFDYTVKKEYADEISEGLMGAFIEFTKDTKNLYETSFEEFKEYTPGTSGPHDPMEALNITTLSSDMYNIVKMYEDFGGWNSQEEYILKFMSGQKEVAFDLGLLKLEYTNYTIDKDNDKESEYDIEYFNTELERLKIKTEENLRNVKTFID